MSENTPNENEKTGINPVPWSYRPDAEPEPNRDAAYALTCAVGVYVLLFGTVMAHGYLLWAAILSDVLAIFFALKGLRKKHLWFTAFMGLVLALVPAGFLVLAFFGEGPLLLMCFVMLCLVLYMSN